MEIPPRRKCSSSNVFGFPFQDSINQDSNESGSLHLERQISSSEYCQQSLPVPMPSRGMGRSMMTEQLAWMGGSPIIQDSPCRHRAPRIAVPSPTRPSPLYPTALVHTTKTATKISIDDLLYAYSQPLVSHRPRRRGRSRSSRSLGEFDLEKVTVEEAEDAGAPHVAHIAKVTRPQLVLLGTNMAKPDCSALPGSPENPFPVTPTTPQTYSADLYEIVPFSPTLPNRMVGWMKRCDARSMAPLTSCEGLQSERHTREAGRVNCRDSSSVGDAELEAGLKEGPGSGPSTSLADIMVRTGAAARKHRKTTL